MKANKALKRLAKIEALISDVTERYSNGALQIREALQDAKAAFARAKEAVGLQASSERVKRAHVKRKKADVQKAAVRASTARTGKKTAPIKKAAKRTVARDAAPPPVKAAPEAAGTTGAANHDHLRH